jgi:AAA15 family ATPase/GTPase
MLIEFSVTNYRAVLCGPNASGKSTLIQALRFTREQVINVYPLGRAQKWFRRVFDSDSAKDVKIQRNISRLAATPDMGVANAPKYFVFFYRDSA